MGIFAKAIFVVVPAAGLTGGHVYSPENADTSIVTSNLYAVPADVAFSGSYCLGTATHNAVNFPLGRVPAVRFAHEEAEDAALTAAAGPPEAQIFPDAEHVRNRESLLAQKLRPQNALLLVPGREGIAKINSIAGDELNCKYIALEITGQDGLRRIEIIILRDALWHHDAAKTIFEAEKDRAIVRVVAAGHMAVPEWEENTIWRNGKSGGYPTQKNRILSPDDKRVTDPVPPAEIAGTDALDEILARYFPGFKIEVFADVF